MYVLCMLLYLATNFNIFFGLGFNVLVNSIKVMSSWSVYLTTPFIGQA